MYVRIRPHPSLPIIFHDSWSKKTLYRHSLVDCDSSKFHLYVCLSVCLCVCLAITAYMSVDINRMLMQLGENVGTEVWLIVSKFHKKLVEWWRHYDVIPDFFYSRPHSSQSTPFSSTLFSFFLPPPPSSSLLLTRLYILYGESIRFSLCVCQWLLGYCYGQLTGTLGLSNIGLGLYLDGWPY